MIVVGLTYDLKDDYRDSGLSPEEVAEFDSPATIAGIEEAVRSLGFSVDRIGRLYNLVRRLAAGESWDFVFNIAEGLRGTGRESEVPCLLDAYDIPYSFSDPMVMALCLHKGMTKRVVRDAGIPTADFAVLGEAREACEVCLPFPLFAKPVAEGTGKGVSGASKVHDHGQLELVCAALIERFRQPVLVETFLPGREFTVGIVGTGARAELIGSMEIIFKREAESGVYSYTNKIEYEQRMEYSPGRDQAAGEAEAVALAAYRLLGCRDGGRIDIRQDAAGRACFIEANPLAGLNPVHSDLPILAGMRGIDYRELIRRNSSIRIRAVSAFNEELSPSQKERGRGRFNVFVVLNTISFTLLGGNFITLYLVRLDATATFIGTVSSFAYLSLFFMVIGRSFASQLGIVRTFALFWLLRNLVTIPLLLSPVLISAGGRDAGFALIVIGLLGFQVFRGIGVVGNSPVIGALSEGKDRGDYLSLIQILTHSTTIVSGVLSAFLLGDQAPLSRYTLFLMVGVATGISASLFLLQVPEPPAQAASAQESLFTSIARANRNLAFRRFLIIFGGTSFLAGMARPFIIVYATDVYAIPDALILMFVVVGSFGALAMGFMNQMLIDRLGAKPLYNFYLVLALLTLLAMLVAPPLSGLFLLGFMGAVFFFFNMAFSGFENSAQSYFYSLVKPEDQLNLGILYFFVMGLGGTLGSLSGGFVLDVASKVFGFGPLGGFRIFFAIMIVGSIPYFIGSLRLASLGSYSFQDALSMIFSLRDLRGILLTKRLDRTRSIGEETRVIQEMAAAPTLVSTELLLERLHSPSYMVRSEALNALENTPPAQNTVRALIAELKLFEYTTAGPAARILGRMKGIEAVPLLRDGLRSPDYLLAAESMVALARCGDLASLPAIRVLFAASGNPLVRIHGAQAMKILADPGSAPILLDALAEAGAPEYLRDELILALAGLYGLEEWFYPYYQNYLGNPRAGVAWLMDHAAQKKPVGPFSYNIEDITQAGLDLFDDIERFGDFMHHVILGLELPVRDAGQALHLLSECAKRAELLGLERFRFLLYGLLVRYLPV